MRALKIYLAGPEVFLADAVEVLAAKSALARDYGFEPVTPLDNARRGPLDPFEAGMAIYRGNVALMSGCDAIIANLTPFRGTGADPGTAFELGFMVARGAQALAYSHDPRSYLRRVLASGYGQDARPGADGEFRGPDGLAIENHEMADNLMLHGAVYSGGHDIVSASVDPDALYRDVSAYEVCLDRLSRANPKTP